jgi:beta-lactamase superfamily II metal-dependent hydrolase
MPGQVTVRMYNVGFGDAFLVTVRRDGGEWRMLIDCGVHSQGQARPIRQSLQAIIGDLIATSAAGVPHLQVIMATHRHADHISGFAFADWEQVSVDEVWLPFVEDENDRDAAALRERQIDTARRLLGLVDRRVGNLDAGQWPARVAAARSFALNAFGNDDSMDRLVGRNGQQFATAHTVRYLPSLATADNEIAIGLEGVTAHVLGPSRDPKDIKQMDPPSGTGWARLDLDETAVAGADAQPLSLFNPAYVVDDGLGRLPDALDAAKRTLQLEKITNDVGLLGAASILEKAVNNTSLFVVLDVAGTRLVFPGDAQYGAWQHVLTDPRKRALVSDAVFYKVGHHGSHNATPKEFVEQVWRHGGYAMLPWGLVKRWQNSIPNDDLLSALRAHHTVIRADAPAAIPGKVTVHDDIWSEITFATA